MDNEKFVFIDDWTPSCPEEEVCKVSRNAIIFPVSEFFDCEQSISFDSFCMKAKRCYNNNDAKAHFDVKEHIAKYINYFLKFYDIEKEYQLYIYRIKCMIDYGIPEKDGTRSKLTSSQFISEIFKHILSDSMYDKVWRLVQDNYQLDLKYKDKTNEALQYNNIHAMYIYEISFFQVLTIPLMMHFAWVNNMRDSQIDNELLYPVNNKLFSQYTDLSEMQRRGLIPADIYQKLYESTNTSMMQSCKRDKVLWDMSEIRGINPAINTNNSLNTIITQVIPKCCFNNNIITFIISSIRNTIRFTVTEISYEYKFTPLSSSKRDGEDNTSQCDKFEAHLIRTDEGLIIQNDFRANVTMDFIIKRFGPFNQNEINFYKNALKENGRPVVNRYQQNLINNMFYKYFGDTVSCNSINIEQYIILMITAKRILLSNNMKILPYVISSKVESIAQRTTICKKERNKIEYSEHYSQIMEKYNNDEKKIKQILSLIATMMASSFTIIDYYDKDLNGRNIVMDSDIIIDEVLMFILQI